MTIWQEITKSISSYPLSFLPDCFLLLGIGIGGFSLRYLNGPTRVILLMLLACFLVEIVLVYYAAILKQNNHFLFNLTSLVEMVCLSMAYHIEINQRKSRQIILTLLATYLITFVYSFEWVRFAEYLLTIERLILLSFVALHFQYILSFMRVPNILAYAMFWVSAGVIVYAAGTFFIFLFTRVTLDNPQGYINFKWYVSVFRGFSCLFYAILGVALYLRRHEVASQTVS